MKNSTLKDKKSQKINDKSLHIMTKKGKRFIKKARKLFQFFLE